MQRDAGARADLVAEHQPGQQFVQIGRAARLVEGEAGGHDGDADMALAEHVAVMRIERVDAAGAGHARAGDRDAPPVQQHARAAIARAQMAGGEVAQDARGRQLRAAGGDAERVEQAAPRLMAHRLRQVGPGQGADEAEDVVDRIGVRHDPVPCRLRRRPDRGSPASTLPSAFVVAGTVGPLQPGYSPASVPFRSLSFSALTHP